MINLNTESTENLSQLRGLMKKHKIDAYIIPATDPHLGEYVSDHWRIIEWITGFTGSAANVVVTDTFAGLWTDSRYFIQATEQLKGSEFELVRLRVPHSPEYISWIYDNLPDCSTIAVNGNVISIGLVKMMEKTFEAKKIILSTDCDLISEIWINRPPLPTSPAFDHILEYAGKERAAKLEEVRGQMKILNVEYHLLTAPDDIMWLLNIRGNDLKYSPLILCYAIVGMEQVLLFVDEGKIPLRLCQEFDKLGIVILPYEETSSLLESLSSDNSLLITPLTTSALLYKSIPQGMKVIEDISIPARLKSKKNPTEIQNIRKVMVSDGIALSRFFFWLETALEKDSVTEITAAEKLLTLRSKQDNFICPSFSTISAYNSHAALPHYSPVAETDTFLGRDGIFLLDSGGQYLGGTTDITRTISLGKPTERQKNDFTLALKGTIDLAMFKFPLGTRGYQIDVIARKALWENGLNYGHGTGHGVGYCLNVHEGPQTIGPLASGDIKTILEPGMVISDEPALYREGDYGFRTENLILCVEDEKTDYGQFLKFETLSLCYIDLSLTNRSLLSEKELNWINNYHRIVFEKLSPFLNEEEKNWLKEKTKSI